MRKIRRPPLSAHAQGVLDNRTRIVRGATDPKKKAEELWEDKQNLAFDEIKQTLEQMASGRARCMYCEDSMGTDIDHFRPKSIWPVSAFVWENYLLACSHCNSNLKRTQFPLLPSGDPALLDPTDPLDDPRRHLLFRPGDGEFDACGPRGPESIQVFGLNDRASPRKLPQGRRAALVKLQLLIRAYDYQIKKPDAAGAALHRQIMLEEPFSAILFWLVEFAAHPDAALFLAPDIPGLVVAHRIDGWL